MDVDMDPHNELVVYQDRPSGPLELDVILPLSDSSDVLKMVG